MILAILIVNTSGKPRLLKFYERKTTEEQQTILKDCFSMVIKRTDRMCNFLEVSKEWGRESKLIYRIYATLVFMFVVDSSESELAILDLIQTFVETLDKTFKNVCELDLVFHSDRVHYILDEIILGGLVVDTNQTEVLQSIYQMSKLESGENPLESAKNDVRHIFEELSRK